MRNSGGKHFRRKLKRPRPDREIDLGVRAALLAHATEVINRPLTSAFGTKLPIRDVRCTVANGGRPDMVPTAHFGRE